MRASEMYVNLSHAWCYAGASRDELAALCASAGLLERLTDAVDSLLVRVLTAGAGEGVGVAEPALPPLHTVELLGGCSRVPALAAGKTKKRARLDHAGIRVRADIIGHARIIYVGKYQSCMVEIGRLLPHASYLSPAYVSRADISECRVIAWLIAALGDCEPQR